MEIELRKVSYIYNEGLAGEVTAVKDVDLRIGGPSFTALIGSTGSGKSTLIQMLDGLLRPSRGEVLFDGNDLYARYQEDENGKRSKRKKETPAQKKILRDIRKKVGIVFQYPESQLFEENVLMDAAYGPKNLGFSKEEAAERARKALLDVGITEEYFSKSPFELSGGEMRRVAIAGVLAMEPEVLILDEPTAGLDPQGKIDILNRIRDIQRQKNSENNENVKKMTVVFVSHNMEEVAEYADRVIAMHNGSKIFDGKTRDLFDDFEAFDETGLKAPEVTYLCRDLGINGVITIDEAAEAIFDKFGRR